jgi:hypothetical protein
MSTLRLVVACALAVVAVAAALLAADVRSWQKSVAQGDAVYAATPKQATWRPSTWLGGAAESVLDAGADVQFRHALQLYAIAASTPDRLDTADELQSARSQAEAALSAAVRGPHASQADTLLGVLAFGASADAATADFTDAVRADQANATAKFDLELALRLTTANGTRPGAGQAGGFGTGGRRGAGGGVPGNGY